MNAKYCVLITWVLLYAIQMTAKGYIPSQREVQAELTYRYALCAADTYLRTTEHTWMASRQLAYDKAISQRTVGVVAIKFKPRMAKTNNEPGCQEESMSNVNISLGRSLNVIRIANRTYYVIYVWWYPSSSKAQNVWSPACIQRHTYMFILRACTGNLCVMQDGAKMIPHGHF